MSSLAKAAGAGWLPLPVLVPTLCVSSHFLLGFRLGDVYLLTLWCFVIKFKCSSARNLTLRKDFILEVPGLITDLLEM